MRYALTLAALVAAAPLLALPAPDRESAADAAVRLVVTRSHYIGRADALLMDDRPDIRQAIKREVVRRGYMLPYQATMFDDGFGHAVQALMYARDACDRERMMRLGPEVPIRYEPPKRDDK